MKNKTDKPSKSGSIFVLIIVAVLVVMAFIYLSANKSERQENQKMPEIIEKQEAMDSDTVVERLGEEEIYTQAPSEKPEEQEPADSPNHDIGDGNYSPTLPSPGGGGQVTAVPAETSVDPIVQGQME